MRIKIPIFQRFQHDELRKVGLADGRADASTIQQLVNNTQKLIRLGLHVPDIRATHDGSVLSDDSLGWVDELIYQSPGVAFAAIDLTPVGVEKKEGKLLRWVSAGIRKDFRDSNGRTYPGLYLDHVAFLGRTKPKIRGMVDLATVQAEPSPLAAAAVMSLPAQGGQGAGVAVFSEIGGSAGSGSSDLLKRHGITPEIWRNQVGDPQCGNQVHRAIRDLQRSANFSEEEATRTLRDAVMAEPEELTAAEFSEVAFNPDLSQRAHRIYKRLGITYPEFVEQVKQSGRIKG